MKGIETVRTDESYWDTIAEPLQSVVSGPWTKNQAGYESGAEGDLLSSSSNKSIVKLIKGQLFYIHTNT
jgi:hypothetical protein